MKKVSLALMVLFLISFTSKLFSGEPDKILHKQCIYPTFLIINENRTGHGSGVVVKSEKTDYGYLNIGLTCAHVVKNKVKNFYIQIPTEYVDYSIIKTVISVECKVLEINEQIDYALVWFVTNEKLPTATMSFDKLYLGNDIFGVGCSLMQPPRLDYGKITSLNFIDVRTSIFTLPGDSGGPVYNNYELIGLKKSILTGNFSRAGVTPIFQVSFMTPISKFKDWSDKCGGIFKFTYNSEEKIPLIYKYQEQFKITHGEKELGWWE